ncbi:MAG TPA: MurR/RpiR family transcriptional regulator [Clostridiaceae bacterium]|nr:MurR/RpiR family transcriptional regulator [Clostridiaceae bacterium]
MENVKNVLIDIQQKYSAFSDVEKRIADTILSDPEKVIHMPIKLFAAHAGVSEGSVINFSRFLGFDGFTQLKINIARNLATKNYMRSNTILTTDDPKCVMRKIIEDAYSSFNATLEINKLETFMQVVDLLNHAERIEIYGVGSSSMVVNDAYYRFLRLGLPAYAVTDAHICSVSASMLNERCVAFGISHTGRTNETLRAMQIASQRGAQTICLTSFHNSPLAKLCKLTILSISKETELHEEAMISRLTQLMVIDSLFAFMSAQNLDKSIKQMDNFLNIVEEHRLKGTETDI